MGDTHYRIMKAARELFEKKGFAAATTKEIADTAGVSEVTLFRHFNNKRALFEETLHKFTHPDKLNEYFENEATYDLEHDLKHLAYKMFEAYRNNAPLFRMIIRDKFRNTAPERSYRQNEQCHQNQLTQYFKTMKEMGKTSADPEMATKFYFSNISGYLMKELLANRQSDENYFKWMLEKVIDVLKS